MEAGTLLAASWYFYGSWVWRQLGADGSRDDGQLAHEVGFIDSRVEAARRRWKPGLVPLFSRGYSSSRCGGSSAPMEAGTRAQRLDSAARLLGVEAARRRLKPRHYVLGHEATIIWCGGSSAPMEAETADRAALGYRSALRCGGSSAPMEAETHTASWRVPHERRCGGSSAPMEAETSRHRPRTANEPSVEASRRRWKPGPVSNSMPTIPREIVWRQLGADGSRDSAQRRGTFYRHMKCGGSSAPTESRD